MKKLIKNKKFWLCLVIILILAALITGCILFFNKEEVKKEIKPEIIKSYTAYVKINPAIKLEFSQTCRNTEEKDICDDPIVTKYELVNEDAKKIFKKIDLIDDKDKLLDVLNLINKTVKKQDVEFDTIEIYSNWSKLEEYMKDKKTNFSYNTNIVPKNELNTIANILNKDDSTYFVTFNTNGGTFIDKQEVKNGEKITRPADPIKEGYEFIEWQVNNKRFNFDNAVTKNITLIAKWKKIETNDNSDKEDKPNDETTSDNNSNDNNDSSDNTDSDDTNNSNNNNDSSDNTGSDDTNNSNNNNDSSDNTGSDDTNNSNNNNDSSNNTDSDNSLNEINDNKVE